MYETTTPSSKRNRGPENRNRLSGRGLDRANKARGYAQISRQNAKSKNPSKKQETTYNTDGKNFEEAERGASSSLTKSVTPSIKRGATDTAIDKNADTTVTNKKQKHNNNDNKNKNKNIIRRRNQKQRRPHTNYRALR